MLNLSAETSAALGERLPPENIAWMTTVAADGQPQSSPVWFLWDYGEFLVYAQPRSWKVQMAAEYSTALRLTPTRVRVY